MDCIFTNDNNSSKNLQGISLSPPPKDKSHICSGQTVKLSITMPDFYEIIKNYFNSENIKTIVDAGSLDGGDAMFFTPMKI